MFDGWSTTKGYNKEGEIDVWSTSQKERLKETRNRSTDNLRSMRLDETRIRSKDDIRSQIWKRKEYDYGRSIFHETRRDEEYDLQTIYDPRNWRRRGIQSTDDLWSSSLTEIRNTINRRSTIHKTRRDEEYDLRSSRLTKTRNTIYGRSITPKIKISEGKINGATTHKDWSKVRFTGDLQPRIEGSKVRSTDLWPQVWSKVRSTGDLQPRIERSKGKINKPMTQGLE